MLINDNYSTLDNCVALAETYTGPVSREMRQIFKAWAWDALASIGPSKMELKSIDLLNKKQKTMIKKPDYYLHSKDLALYKDGVEVKYKYNNRAKDIHINDDANSALVYLYEDNDFFVVSDPTIDCLKLVYYSLPIDEDGEALVPNSYVSAIATFVYASYLERNTNFIAKSQMIYNRWLNKRKAIRGSNKMPSMLEGEEILSRWMTMIGARTNKYRN